jgi:hypothetical protein
LSEFGCSLRELMTRLVGARAGKDGPSYVAGGGLDGCQSVEHLAARGGQASAAGALPASRVVVAGWSATAGTGR